LPESLTIPNPTLIIAVAAPHGEHPPITLRKELFS